MHAYMDAVGLGVYGFTYSRHTINIACWSRPRGGAYRFGDYTRLLSPSIGAATRNSIWFKRPVLTDLGLKLGFSLDIYRCKYFQTGEQMSDEHTGAVTQSTLMVYLYNGPSKQ